TVGAAEQLQKGGRLSRADRLRAQALFVGARGRSPRRFPEGRGPQILEEKREVLKKGRSNLRLVLSRMRGAGDLLTLAGRWGLSIEDLSRKREAPGALQGLGAGFGPAQIADTIIAQRLGLESETVRDRLTRRASRRARPPL